MPEVPREAAKALAESMKLNQRGYRPHIGDPVVCAEIDLRAAYPAIRKQVIAEVEEALTVEIRNAQGEDDKWQTVGGNALVAATWGEVKNRLEAVLATLTKGGIDADA